MELKHLITEITLGTGREVQESVAQVKAGDKHIRFIEAKIMNNNQEYQIPEDAIVSVNMRKPDGKWCYNKGIVDQKLRQSDRTENKVIFELTPQATASSGMLYCEMEIRSSNTEQVFTTNPFTIEIGARVIEDEIIESSNELTAFDARWKLLDESHELWSLAESLRKENESARIQAEQQRKLEEQKRQDAEQLRIQAENERIAAEEYRPKINDEIISKTHLWSSSKLHDAITPEVRTCKKRTAFTPAEGYPITATTSIAPKLSGEEIPNREKPIPDEGEQSPSPQIPRHIEPWSEITLIHEGGGQDECTKTTVQLPVPCYIGFYNWNTGEYISLGVKFTSADMTVKETRILPDYKHGCIVFNAPEEMGGACLLGWCSVVKLVCCPWFPMPEPDPCPDPTEEPFEPRNETPDCPHVVFDETTVELWLPLKVIGNDDTAIRSWVQETNKTCPVEFCTFGKKMHRENLSVIADLTPKSGMNVISCDSGDTLVEGKCDFLATMAYYGASFDDLAYLMMVRRGELETLSKYDPNSPNYVPREKYLKK